MIIFSLSYSYFNLHVERSYVDNPDFEIATLGWIKLPFQAHGFDFGLFIIIIIFILWIWYVMFDRRRSRVIRQGRGLDLI